jgi:hypothetical protein
VGLRGWFCLTVGAILLFAGVVSGILAIQHATEIAAYHHARACPAGAPFSADCLRTVDGSVAGVTEVSGDNELAVQTASTTLHLRFSSDSPMLGYAVDGNLAVVTTWRGIPVSVMTDGRSDVSMSVPETALAGDLSFAETTGGMGLVFVVMALLIRQGRRTGTGYTYLRRRPLAAAAVSMLVPGGLVVAIGGGILDGQPSRLGPDLTLTGGALVVVAGLSAWFGVVTRRRAAEATGRFARPPGVTEGAYGLSAPVVPTTSSTALPMPAAGTRLRMRTHPATAARVLSARAVAYVPMLLTVAVLFGVFVTVHDGPLARAFRTAPACIGQTNLTTCVGDFTAVINGVRAPANGANGADVSYVTSDGAINTWASFGGNTATIVRLASTDEEASTPVRIRVWRGAIVAAQYGGQWHSVWDGPPGNTIPTIFLAVSFALLLLAVRLRIRRRAASETTRGRLLIEDVGQVAVAACSVVLLAYGFWPGAALAVAVLVWLGLSVRQSMQRKRMKLAALHSS